MARDVIEMTLTPRERSLLRYAYPFEQVHSELQPRSKSRKIEVVPVSRFELEQLIGNPCYSINRMKPGVLLDSASRSLRPARSRRALRRRRA